MRAEQVSEIQFFGLKLSGGKPAELDVASTDDVVEMVHITALALGEKASPGQHTIKINYGGQEFVLGTLDSERGVYQVALDTVLERTATFINTGKTPVYLTGYKTTSSVGEYEDFDEEFSEEGSSEEEDEEEAPMAVPLQQNGRGGNKKAPQLMDEDEEDSEEDESYEADSDDEDDDDDDELDGKDFEDDGDDDEDEDVPSDIEMNSDDVVGVVDSGTEEEDDEEDDDEDSPSPPPKGKKQQQQQQQQQVAAKGGKKEAAADGGKGAKRPAPAAAPTPAAKKSKTPADGEAKTPAAGPSSSGAAGFKTPAATGGATPANEVDYEKALVSYLRSTSGKATLSALGGAVKKPDGKMKLTEFVKKRPSMFHFDATTQLVSLAKK